MRARLFVITSLAVATVIGGASAAYAQPQGPGDVKYQPKPTTTTTAAPKGPDKVAAKPTTTTIPPGPKGPGDIANPQSDPVVDPAPKGDDNPTTMGDDEANLVNAGDKTGTDTGVKPANLAENSNSARPAQTADSSGLPVIVLVLVAGLVGALLALVATRMRGQHDEHASQV